MVKIPEEHIYARINKVLKGRAHIGGGALRSFLEGKQPRDIDVFMIDDNMDKFDEVIRDLLCILRRTLTNKLDGYTTVGMIITDGAEWFSSQYELTVVVPKEIGGRFLYGTPYELVKGFDFTCTAMVLLEDNSILFNSYSNTMFDIEYKLLNIQKGIPVDKRTLKRIETYAKYGYSYRG